jgi:hypothetical protein
MQAGVLKADIQQQPPLFHVQGSSLCIVDYPEALNQQTLDQSLGSPGVTNSL